MNPTPTDDPVTTPADDQIAPPSSATEPSAPAPADTTPAPAQPAAEPQKSEPETMEEVIARALEAGSKPEPKPEDAAPAPDGKEAASDPNPDEDKTEPDPAADPTSDAEIEVSEDDLNRASPKLRKRMSQLLNQRRIYKERAETALPDAEGYRTIRRYMAENDLVDAEVAELFRLGADLKSGDPVRIRAFVDAIQPRLQAALVALGQVLPDDLSEAVETGEMTEAAARQLAETRYARAHAEQRAEKATQQVQQVQTQRTVADIQTSVAAWTQSMQSQDPDFALKAEAMRRVAQALVLEKGHPKSAAEAVAYAKQAHAEATKMLTAGRPGPQPTRPTPSPTTPSVPSNAVRPEPKSLGDVIDRVLGAPS